MTHLTQSKICSICKEEKSLDEYFNHIKIKDGKYSSCRECERIKNRLRYQNNKKERSEKAKQFYQKNKEKITDRVKEYYSKNKKQRINSVKNWTQNNKEQASNNWRSSSLKRYYGITEEIYQELLEKQNYCCAICNKHQDLEKKRFAVDHAHTKSEFIPEGAIRGLLCWSCNHRFVGKHTDPVLFESAAKYLRQHTGLIVPEKYTKGRKTKRKKKKIV